MNSGFVTSIPKTPLKNLCLVRARERQLLLVDCLARGVTACALTSKPQPDESDTGNVVCDHRFYHPQSDHLLLWNEAVKDPSRHVKPKLIDGSNGRNDHRKAHNSSRSQNLRTGSFSGSVIEQDLLTDSVVGVEEPTDSAAPYADLYGTLKGEIGQRPTKSVEQDLDLLDLGDWESLEANPSSTVPPSPSSGGVSPAATRPLAGLPSSDAVTNEQKAQGAPELGGSLASPMGQAIDILGSLT